MIIIFAEIRSPDRQMRPMNPSSDPRSYHGWSVWRPMDSLGFAENLSEWKWTDDSTDDALISNVHCALVKCRPRLVDNPELRRTTQPSTMGGPLGEPGFSIFCSTVFHEYALTLKRLPCYWPFVRGVQRSSVPVGSPHKGPAMLSVDVISLSLYCCS